MVGNMGSIAESPMQENAFWWRPKNGLDLGLLPCELVELSPSLPRKRLQNGGSGTFHQIVRPRRGSMQSEAFSEPIFQKQGKLITFFRGIILPRTSAGKSKRRKKVFQVDLAEYLFGLGLDVPQVVTICSQFIELRGLVDGVYRLSGISSNIQRLRRSFDDAKIPDLFNDRLVLQDIHSVSSLLKLYFRELPAPVCTFHLYDQFVAAVKAGEAVRLYQLRDVIAQLPDSNYSTLEYLMKHLHRVSLHHKDTGMTAKNLAIVWAPNLLRCQSLEAGGVEALQGVAVQAVVTEYLIKYCHLIFSDQSPSSECNTPRSVTRASQQSFPISSPMKLLSLEEAQMQAHTFNRRNQITPLESMLVNQRKKVKPWRRKHIFAVKERKEYILSDEKFKGLIGCPCIGDTSQMSTTPGSTYLEPAGPIGNIETMVSNECDQARYWAEHPVQFDVDMDTDMENKVIPNKKDLAQSSPVIMRCTRQGDESMMDLSFKEKRSSLRDKFRKFALSPISSNQSMAEKMGNIGGNLDCEEVKEQLKQCEVKQLDLHRSDSLEFIDASSDDSEFEMSPSTKRSKFHNPVEEPKKKIDTDITLNYATPMSIKEGGNKKVETKLLECKPNKTSIKLTLDITSENNEAKSFVIKSFEKEKEAIKLDQTNTHTKDNAQKDASNAIEEHVAKCKETEAGSTSKDIANEDFSGEKGDLKKTSLTSKERINRYKDERRFLLREKYKAENYLSPVEQAAKIRSRMNEVKDTESKTPSDLKIELPFPKQEAIKAEQNKRVDEENKNMLTKPPKHYSVSTVSLGDPTTRLPETKVSSHRVVLRLSHSCPVQGQTPNSDSSSSKVGKTEDERAGQMVNVKERVNVFEPKKKELKTKPNMILIPPPHSSITSIPSSPSKIKSMAAMFEHNR